MHELEPDDTESKTECFYDRTIDGSNACNAGHSIYVRRCMWDDSSREKKLTGE